MASKETVLVTGGTGFVGVYCIIACLNKGYDVRTTVRSMKRADDVRAMLKNGDIADDEIEGVKFFVADLVKDDGWEEACQGCTYVLHVASPFPATSPKNADDLIIPAREGTLRALRAAKKAGSVKRVVVTSSVAAIVYGHPEQEAPFTEEDWTDVKQTTIPIAPYQQSKTFAERAAWDWWAKDGDGIELSVVNPAGIFGPILSKDYSTSIEFVLRMINGSLPGLPQLKFGCVDVRDVADLHLLAMTEPKANGQRYIALSDDGFLTGQEMARMLKDRLGERARKVPTRNLPNILLRMVAFFDNTVALIVPELGKSKNATNVKAKKELGWRPRSAVESLITSAESLYQFGVVK